MHLASNIFVASFEGRSIVLDIERDRYIGLGAELTSALFRIIDGDGSEADHRSSFEAAQTKLLSRGILSSTRSSESRVLPSAPTHTTWPREGAGSALDLTQGARSALRALTEVEISLRYRPFRATIGWLRVQRSRLAHAKHSRTEHDIIDDFFMARPLFPVKPVCRLDAMALSLMLWRAGHPAELVFGVRVEPFRAHCWVQHHSATLNEPHERVRQFSPLMAI